MAFTWKPAVYSPANTTTLFLPRPISSCDLPFGFSFDTHKVPLKDGAKTFGRSADAFTVTFAGQIGIGTDGSTKRLTELAMFDDYTLFASHLAAGDKDTKVELFLFYDSASSTYRKFKNVRPQTFALQLGDQNCHIYAYTATFFVEDPNVYTTAEGV